MQWLPRFGPVQRRDVSGVRHGSYRPIGAAGEHAGAARADCVCTRGVFVDAAAAIGWPGRSDRNDYVGVRRVLDSRGCLGDWIVTGIPVAVVRAIAGPVAALPVVAALLLYFPLFESSARQGTFGKQICGLAVTDTRGQRISFGRALGRYFAKFLSALVLGIGFLMVAFTPRKRGLHDLIAGTLVVRR